jgi:hypothetical protein
LISAAEKIIQVHTSHSQSHADEKNVAKHLSTVVKIAFNCYPLKDRYSTYFREMILLNKLKRQFMKGKIYIL